MSARRRWFWPLALVGMLGACTPAQVERATTYQDAVAAMCSTAMLFTATPVGPWIVGGCAGEAAIAKLALDPNALTWLRDLIVKAKAR